MHSMIISTLACSHSVLPAKPEQKVIICMISHCRLFDQVVPRVHVQCEYEEGCQVVRISTLFNLSNSNDAMK